MRHIEGQRRYWSKRALGKIPIAQIGGEEDVMLVGAQLVFGTYRGGMSQFSFTSRLVEVSGLGDLT